MRAGGGVITKGKAPRHVDSFSGAPVIREQTLLW